MAHVRQLQPPRGRASSLPAVLRVQRQVELDPAEFGAIIQQQACVDDSLQRGISSVDGVRAEPLISKDDEVQFIFCAPRRRKKRRRRVDSAHGHRTDTDPSTSPGDPVSRPQVDRSSPSIHHVLPQPSRRRSIGVIDRLELCHIGKEKSPSLRAGSLPSMSYDPSDCSTSQCPWFAEPSYWAAPTSHFPSLMDSTAWWDQSLPALQPRPLPSIPWRPIHSESSNPNKRKHDNVDETAARLSHLGKSFQVSPRATPASEIPSLVSPFSTDSNHWHIHGPSQHFLTSDWRPSSRDTFKNSSDQPHPGPSVSQEFPSRMDSSEPDADTKVSSASQNMPVRNELGITSGEGPWCQNSGQNKAEVPPKATLIPSSQPPHSTGARGDLLRRFQSPVSPSKSHNPTSLSETMPLSHINTPHASPLVSQDRPVLQATSSHIPAAPIQPRRRIRVTESSDMLRKPSLYSIPSWPSHLDSTQASNIIQFHTRSPMSNVNSSFGRSSDTIQTRKSHAGRLILPNPVVAQRTNSETRPQVAAFTAAKTATTALPVSREGVGSDATTFQIPKARLGRKRSPNLIVDVAETCQELFPFAEVAERHEVPIQKVFDTFSAIIQLPLLRNADDKRRHGSLGKRRMKEYRDAKRAMEKAQEAERKGQTKGIKARGEDAAKGKEERDWPLLKSAVLKNAREIHGAR